MADRSLELALQVTADTNRAAAGLTDVGDAARTMAADVESASRSSAAAAGRMDQLAGASDNVASKGAQAAGALSGLGDLIGGPFGAAMQTGGVAMQAAADAGDLLNVVTESAIVKKVKDTAVTAAQTAKTVAHTAVTKAATAATKAQAVAQRVLNAVMRANPIGLIITAVLALVAGFVLLYKRSETFRKIVHKVGQVGKASIGAVVSAVRSLIGWVRDRLGPAWTWIRGKAADALDAIRGKFGPIMDKARDVFNRVRELVADALRKAGQTVAGFKTTATNAFDALVAPIRRVIGWVQDLVNKIQAIDFPDLPSLPFIGGSFRATTTTPTLAPAAPAATTAAAPPPVNINVVVNGALDPYAVARQIRDILTRYDVLTGRS